MDISVVICTKNRAMALERCLSAIFSNDFNGSWEVIVVDNNSGDETQRVIANMRPRCPVPFHALVELAPGNSAGRNAGIGIAQGDVIFFTDDDCIAEPNVLREMWRVFRDARIGYAGGRIILHDPHDYPISTMNVAEAIEIQPGSFVCPGLVQGSNMAFRREALISLGGFDPLFGAGATFAGEELVLASRASLDGWYGGYFPGPTVRHAHGRNLVMALATQSQYDFGIGAYYAKFVFDTTVRWKCLAVWGRRSLKQLFVRPSGMFKQFAGAIHYARMRGGHA